ncbi:hypothetical protein ACQ4PT_056206 [Festuca glaucescens]
MPITKSKVDLDCSRCHSKIEKVLGGIREKGEFMIDEIKYDEKMNKVIVTGPSTLTGSPTLQGLQDHQGFIIKEIEIVEPPPPPQSRPTRSPRRWSRSSRSRRRQRSWSQSCRRPCASRSRQRRTSLRPRRRSRSRQRRHAA